MYRRSGDGFGELVLQTQYDGGQNPSYLCVNSARTRIYVVNEAYAGNETGNLVSAYAFDQSSGQLTLINAVETGGAAACHVDLSPNGRHLAVATYLGGSVALFSIRDDGGMGGRTSFHQHTEHADADPDRQSDGPHVHMAKFDNSGQHVLVPDLGVDKVYVYSLNEGNGALTLASTAALPPGSGPRHLVCHPAGKWIYVVNEMLSTVTAFVWHVDGDAATLRPLQESLPTVPGAAVGIGGHTFCAAIRISPDGRFVYASNRGHDSISCFQVGQDGTLAHKGMTLTAPDGAKQPPACDLAASWPPRDCPRDFNLCGEHGEWLVVGNQDSDTLVGFARDVKTGVLVATGTAVECPAPVCVLAF